MLNYNCLRVEKSNIYFKLPEVISWLALLYLWQSDKDKLTDLETNLKYLKIKIKLKVKKVYLLQWLYVLSEFKIK